MFLAIPSAKKTLAILRGNAASVLGTLPHEQRPLFDF